MLTDRTSGYPFPIDTGAEPEPCWDCLAGNACIDHTPERWLTEAIEDQEGRGYDPDEDLAF